MRKNVHNRVNLESLPSTVPIRRQITVINSNSHTKTYQSNIQYNLKTYYLHKAKTASKQNRALSKAKPIVVPHRAENENDISKR